MKQKDSMTSLNVKDLSMKQRIKLLVKHAHKMKKEDLDIVHLSNKYHVPPLYSALCVSESKNMRP